MFLNQKLNYHFPDNSLLKMIALSNTNVPITRNKFTHLKEPKAVKNAAQTVTRTIVVQ